VQFLPKTVAALYSAIVTGPDGNIWFIDENAPGLVRMSVSGGIHEFPLAGVDGNAVSMTVGKDKNFYILDETSNVVRVTLAGAVDIIPIPSGDTTSVDGLALGPDGNVWFAEFDHIGKITPAGKITEYAYPAP
jgi:virginiamycin B lyase